MITCSRNEFNDKCVLCLQANKSDLEKTNLCMQNLKSDGKWQIFVSWCSTVIYLRILYIFVLVYQRNVYIDTRISSGNCMLILETKE